MINSKTSRSPSNDYNTALSVAINAARTKRALEGLVTATPEITIALNRVMEASQSHLLTDDPGDGFRHRLAKARAIFDLGEDPSVIQVKSDPSNPISDAIIVHKLLECKPFREFPHDLWGLRTIAEDNLTTYHETFNNNDFEWLCWLGYHLATFEPTAHEPGNFRLVGWGMLSTAWNCIEAFNQYRMMDAMPVDLFTSAALMNVDRESLFAETKAVIEDELKAPFLNSRGLYPWLPVFFMSEPERCGIPDIEYIESTMIFKDLPSIRLAAESIDVVALSTINSIAEVSGGLAPILTEKLIEAIEDGLMYERGGDMAFSEGIPDRDRYVSEGILALEGTVHIDELTIEQAQTLESIELRLADLGISKELTRSILQINISQSLVTTRILGLSAILQASVNLLPTRDVNGVLINAAGHLVDEQGRLIDEQGRLVDSLERIINADGHLINDEGHLIDGNGVLVNADGHLINADGHLINADGALVNADGALVDAEGQLIVPACPGCTSEDCPCCCNHPDDPDPDPLDPPVCPECDCIHDPDHDHQCRNPCEAEGEAPVGVTIPMTDERPLRLFITASELAKYVDYAKARAGLMQAIITELNS